MSKPKIFLSYSHNNKKRVDEIRNILQNKGYSVLGDHEVNIGELLSDRIFDQIKQADYYVIFISPQYFESPNSSNEFYKILGYSQENKNKSFIPVVLDYALIPPEIGDRLYLDGVGKNIGDIAVEIIKTIHRNEGQKAAEKDKLDKRIEKINTSIVQYIKPIIDDLNNRENKLKKQADFWYKVGYFSLVVGILSAVIIILADIFISTDFDWNRTVYLGIKAAVLLILLLAISKYAFSLAKSYMNESLKNADRRHAISFGEFYINVFENSIDSKDFKEIFENWNLKTDSSFSNLSTNNYDPKIIDKTTELMKSIKQLSQN